MSATENKSSSEAGDEQLDIPCVICGYQRKCSTLEKHNQVVSHFCELLGVGMHSEEVNETNSLLMRSYYCSDCCSDMMAISRLVAEVEKINKALEELKVTCISKLSEDVPIAEDSADGSLTYTQLENRLSVVDLLKIKGFADPLEPIIWVAVKEELENYSSVEDTNGPLTPPDFRSSDGEVGEDSMETKLQSFARPLRHVALKRVRPIGQSQSTAIVHKYRLRANKVNGSPSALEDPLRVPTPEIPKRKPGRPKGSVKKKPPVKKHPSTHWKKRGRPRKVLPEEEIQEDVLDSPSATASSVVLESYEEFEHGSEAEGEVKAEITSNELLDAPISAEDSDGCVNPLSSPKDVNSTIDPTPSTQLKEFQIKVCRLSDDDPLIANRSSEWNIGRPPGCVSFSPYRYMCPLMMCRKEFTTVAEVKSHFRSFHASMPDPFECQDCYRSFPTKLEYDVHVAACLTLNVKGAGAQTSREVPHGVGQNKPGPSLRRSANARADEDDDQGDPDYNPTEWKSKKPPPPPKLPKFVCTVENCNALFRSQTLLDGHTRTSHEGFKYPYVCSVCSKGYKDLRSYKDHANLHLKQTPYSCPKCEMQFPTRVRLEYHVESAHKGNKFQCDTCGQICRTRGHFRVHVRLHDESRPHICEVCGLGFKKYHRLQSHRQEHPELNLPRNICQYCGKEFKSQTYLKDHEKLHTGDDLLICELCGYRTTRKHLLDIHMISHSEAREYECEICHKKYKTEMAVRKHKECCHALTKEHSCDVCGKYFASRIRLVVHKALHKGRTYPCSDCGSKFSRPGNLKRHRKAHHNPSSSSSSSAGPKRIRTGKPRFPQPELPTPQPCSSSSAAVPIPSFPMTFEERLPNSLEPSSGSNAYNPEPTCPSTPLNPQSFYSNSFGPQFPSNYYGSL